MTKTPIEQLIEDIEQAEKDNQLAIVERTDDDITTDDFEDDRIINYHIGKITYEWLTAHISWMPSAQRQKELYEKQLLNLLIWIDPNMLTTLKRIYIAADETDIDTICEIADTEEWTFPSCIDLIDHDGCIGCNWWSESSIIIDMGAIDAAIKELAEEAESNGDYFNEAAEEYIGFFTTIIHELRHLGLSNPFLDQKQYPTSEESEEAVEDWALKMYHMWHYGTKYKEVI